MQRHPESIDGVEARGPVVLAAAAHPDDIEFMMAGTLLRLKAAGARLHMWNLANGCCGSDRLSRGEISRVRWQEAGESALIAGAQLHPPLADDGFILYDAHLLARAAAVIRKVQPEILLLPSPDDYMEDHQNTSRLLVTAAFVRAMKNFPCEPPTPPYKGEMMLYHALPHGLHDGLRRLIRPGQVVDIEPVLGVKRKMLSCHESQRSWLEATQGMDSYLAQMESLSAEVGRRFGPFRYAEGWRRHSHLGFRRQDADPLKDLLGDACWIDPEYEQHLSEPCN